MRHLCRTLIALVAVAGAAAATGDPLQLATAFTLQGRLEQGGELADGLYDFELELYDQRQGGTLLATLTVLDAPVRQGQFALELDFGEASRRAPEGWVEVRVREAAGGAFTPLEPRQPVAATTTTTCTVGSLAVSGTAGVGMGTAPTASALEVRGTESDGSTTAAAVLKSGVGLAAQTMFLDGDEIDVFSLSSQLHLNSNAAGDVTLAAGGGKVGVGNTTPAVRLHVTDGTDAAPGGGGFLALGSLAGLNLALDSNEIMARNNGATATLHLNADGGDVKVGGVLDIGLEVVTSPGGTNLCDGDGAVTVNCPAGKRVLGGGCSSTVAEEEIESSHPVGTTSWYCRFDACPAGNFQTFVAYAICARVK